MQEKSLEKSKYNFMPKEKYFVARGLQLQVSCQKFFFDWHRICWRLPFWQSAGAACHFDSCIVCHYGSR
jgi:hypothetical protein